MYGTPVMWIHIGFNVDPDTESPHFFVIFAHLDPDQDPAD
jgi:hypothetical protein